MTCSMLATVGNDGECHTSVAERALYLAFVLSHPVGYYQRGIIFPSQGLESALYDLYTPRE